MIKLQKETFDEKQPLLTFAQSGRCRVALYIGEETAIVSTPTAEGGETEERTVYAYNVGWFAADSKITDEEEAVAALKAAKIAEIDTYDTSSAVNSFSLQGKQMWLPKETRVGLVNSITIEKAAGKETTVLWFDGEKYELPVDTALQMLSALELYALECYNVTAAHKALVLTLSDVSEIIAFKIQEGYPTKLNF